MVNTTPDAANFESQIALDDLAQQIRSIKSLCTLESERHANRPIFKDPRRDPHRAVGQLHGAQRIAAFRVTSLALGQQPGGQKESKMRPNF